MSILQPIQALTSLTIITLSLGSLVTNPQTALANYQWQTARSVDLPSAAIVGGFDNGNLYICRVTNGTPGKLRSKDNQCYIPSEGKEYKYTKYQVLVGSNWSWERRTGSIPQNAVVGGIDLKTQDVLYICSAFLRLEKIADKQPTIVVRLPGKYHPQHNSCYVSYQGKEYKIQEANILIAR